MPPTPRRLIFIFSKILKKRPPIRPKAEKDPMMDPIARFPDLDGASVYITGGGSGVGAALTDGFLAQGAQVAFIGRSDASGFVEEMRSKHGARLCSCRAT